VAVGDRYCLSLSSPTSDKKQVNHDFQHIDEICLSTQVLMKGSLVCIVQLSENSTEGIILTDISKKVTKKFPLLPFKPNTVPYDFDGNRLLWMEWEGKVRNFKFYDFELTDVKNFAVFHRNYGQIGFCKLVDDFLVFVKDFRSILAVSIQNAHERIIARHQSDIVALNWFRFKEKKTGNDDQHVQGKAGEEKIALISVDYNCNIKIWSFEQCLYSVNITEFNELTDEYRQEFYFTMGYPYFVVASGHRIAVSTDLGVLVINVPYFSQISVISEDF
jgi:hypothetical protein